MTNIKNQYAELNDGQFVTVGVAGGINMFESPKVGTTGLAGASQADQEINMLLGDEGDEEGTGGSPQGGFSTIVELGRGRAYLVLELVELAAALDKLLCLTKQWLT